MKVFNRIESMIDPWGTLLIIAVQTDLVPFDCYSTAIDASNAMGHPTAAFTLEINTVKTL